MENKASFRLSSIPSGGSHRGGGGGVTSTPNTRGCAILTKQVTPKNPGTYLKLRPKNPGAYLKLRPKKSRNLKCQALCLYEKTHHPDQKVLHINSTFQFYFCFMMFVQRVLDFPQPLSV